jgi:hypothetical protein
MLVVVQQLHFLLVFLLLLLSPLAVCPPDDGAVITAKRFVLWVQRSSPLCWVKEMTADGIQTHRSPTKTARMRHHICICIAERLDINSTIPSCRHPVLWAPCNCLPGCFAAAQRAGG